MREHDPKENREALIWMFDRVAPTYDALNHILSFGIDFLWRKRTVRALGIQPGDRVLDVATGTGDLALEALSEKGCQVVGIDLSEEMLRVARQKGGESGVGYALVLGDACDMPFADRTFDAAMISYGLRNIPQHERFLREALRVLKKGARLAILEFSLPAPPLFRRAYLRYFDNVMPRLGEFISGNGEPYYYLRESVKAFPEPPVIEAKVKAAGFRMVRSRSMTFGICHLYVAARAAD